MKSSESMCIIFYAVLSILCTYSVTKNENKYWYNVVSKEKIKIIHFIAQVYTTLYQAFYKHDRHPHGCVYKQSPYVM